MHVNRLDAWIGTMFFCAANMVALYMYMEYARFDSASKLARHKTLFQLASIITYVPSMLNGCFASYGAAVIVSYYCNFYPERPNNYWIIFIFCIVLELLFQ